MPMLITRPAGLRRRLDRARRRAPCFNLYRPPIDRAGDPSEGAAAGSIMSATLYPDDADHIVQWLAHRVQHPGEKINHALVLGGAPGIGKDTLLEPVKHGGRAVEFHRRVAARTCSAGSTAS